MQQQVPASRPLRRGLLRSQSDALWKMHGGDSTWPQEAASMEPQRISTMFPSPGGIRNKSPLSEGGQRKRQRTDMGSQPTTLDPHAAAEQPARRRWTTGHVAPHDASLLELLAQPACLPPLSSITGINAQSPSLGQSPGLLHLPFAAGNTRLLSNGARMGNDGSAALNRVTLQPTAMPSPTPSPTTLPLQQSHAPLQRPQPDPGLPHVHLPVAAVSSHVENHTPRSSPPKPVTERPGPSSLSEMLNIAPQSPWCTSQAGGSLAAIMPTYPTIGSTGFLAQQHQPLRLNGCESLHLRGTSHQQQLVNTAVVDVLHQRDTKERGEGRTQGGAINGPTFSHEEAGLGRAEAPSPWPVLFGVPLVPGLKLTPRRAN